MHAPSLCLGINDVENLVSCSHALARACTSLGLSQSDIKFQRLAIVVDRQSSRGALWDADVWRGLASSLVQPHLKTVCITFNEWDDELEREGNLALEEVSLCFKDGQAKVTVRKMIIQCVS